LLQQLGGVIYASDFANSSLSVGGDGGVLDVIGTLTNTGVYSAGPGEYSIDVGTADVVSQVTTYVGGTLDGTGTLAVGTDGSDDELLVNAGSVAATQTVTFDVLGDNELLAIGTLAGFGAVIGTFDATSEIILAGTSIVTDAFSNGTLTLYGIGGAELGTLAIGSGVDPSLLTVNVEGGVGTARCFVAGTRISTDCGEVKVEAIRIGDKVRVLLGDGPEGDGVAPVIWVGRREVDCASHPAPGKVWPVRVSAGALGPGRPHTAVFLSPDHAIHVEEVLIPVRYLINGSTIMQVPVARVTYCHLELAEHEVLLAQGLPAESFLMMKDGWKYLDRAEPVQLLPDFSARMWEAFGCARLVVTGAKLAAARALVDRYARVLVERSVVGREAA